MSESGSPVPTTESIREFWATVYDGPDRPDQRAAAFDRWLADHDAEVRSEAAREAEQRAVRAETMHAEAFRIGIAKQTKIAAVEALRTRWCAAGPTTTFTATSAANQVDKALRETAPEPAQDQPESTQEIAASGEPEDPETSAREVAIGRLMTMSAETSPERRRVQAEWVLDGLLAVIDARPAIVITRHVYDDGTYA